MLRNREQQGGSLKEVMKNDSAVMWPMKICDEKYFGAPEKKRWDDTYMVHPPLPPK
jgi:hypothetical protein